MIFAIQSGKNLSVLKVLKEYCTSSLELFSVCGANFSQIEQQLCELMQVFLCFKIQIFWPFL